MKIVALIISLWCVTGSSFAQDYSDQFLISPITQEIFERIDQKSYKEGCPVGLEDLVYLQILHYNAQQEILQGELICNRAIANDLIEIFKVLFDAKYPIERMKLIDDYQADDHLSMRDNNSSAFNYRRISGSSKLSNHSWGMAIDLNPLYNPYVRERNGQVMVDPVEAVEYVDREVDEPYMIRKGDLCYREFVKRGFAWGGDWRSVKDYQHFEKTQ